MNHWKELNRTEAFWEIHDAFNNKIKLSHWNTINIKDKPLPAAVRKFFFFTLDLRYWKTWQDLFKCGRVLEKQKQRKEANYNYINMN